MTLKTRHWDRIDNGGVSFTELGFGTAPLGNLYRAISDGDARATLDAAWEGGVRYYDTAPLYGLGLSETRLNPFLRDKPRDDYVLSSKVGRLMQHCAPEHRAGVGKWFDVPQRREQYDYTYDGVMRSVEHSFSRLGVDRIDILYVHDLCVFSHGSKEASDMRIEEFFGGRGYDAMVSLRDQGMIRAIGGGVNEWEVCQTLAERGDFDLFLLAGRYTLLEQEALNSFLPLCEKRGIGIVTGGPYNSGILATGARPGAFYNYDPAPQTIIERVNAIEATCKDHGVRMVDAAFHFPLLHPAHVSVIPGGQGVSEMHANLQAAQAKIPNALWKDLKAKGLMREDAPT
ncbi:Pyridoxal 4-dehydrogenase [Roseobacter fucihabitans]|uniref:Pyridoxal 4-dehydrogenase n=1 Tax=Roseobacter fucihabitans TaxID=1537242 RepID=A0ABZ2BRA7_9RHOB|nr:aldo/keto reductase [Roseobacter litoralis]MBC6966638.1 Pyridoxal 4-dehydrogenase [Roseobacter litoralis]